jgi:hypothetical protein
VTTLGWYDLGTSHAPGSQQAPASEAYAAQYPCSGHLLGVVRCLQPDFLHCTFAADAPALFTPTATLLEHTLLAQGFRAHLRPFSLVA